jgi:AraC-like DNA-binding protein
LEDLADEAGMSQYHFCRQFKKRVGTTPGAYRRERA